MPDDPSSPPKPPARTLDRAGLERVLARAARAAERPRRRRREFFGGAAARARQGGWACRRRVFARRSPRNARARSLPMTSAGLPQVSFGPSRVSTSRVVPGRPADVLAAIDTWMQRQELLIVKRHHADRIVWEPRRDFFVGVKRALKRGGRDYALSQAFEVSATVLPIDDSQVHVGLDADFRSSAHAPPSGWLPALSLAGSRQCHSSPSAPWRWSPRHRSSWRLSSASQERRALQGQHRDTRATLRSSSCSTGWSVARSVAGPAESLLGRNRRPRHASIHRAACSAAVRGRGYQPSSNGFVRARSTSRAIAALLITPSMLSSVSDFTSAARS